MKKLFALILIICIFTIAFCITAFAAEISSANGITRENTELVRDSENARALGLVDNNNKDGGSMRFGSIFGEGSLAMILSLVALVLSVASICISVSLLKNKKSLSSKKTDDEDKDEDEE